MYRIDIYRLRLTSHDKFYFNHPKKYILRCPWDLPDKNARFHLYMYSQRFRIVIGLVSQSRPPKKASYIVSVVRSRICHQLPSDFHYQGSFTTHL